MERELRLYFLYTGLKVGRRLGWRIARFARIPGSGEVKHLVIGRGFFTL